MSYKIGTTDLAFKEKGQIKNSSEGYVKGKDSFLNKKERRTSLVLGFIILAILLIGGAIWLATWLIEASLFVSTDYASLDANHVNISAKILGRIKEFFVEEGSLVQIADPILTLEDSDLKAQERLANASLASAQANLKLASINLAKVQNDYKRIQDLYRSGTATREQFENASFSLQAAEAQASLALAQVDVAKAQLGLIENQLLNTVIRAPFSGIIARKSFGPGDVVQPSQTICLINDLSKIWVVANFEETQIQRIVPGAQAEVWIEALPGRSLKGKVEKISGAILPPPFSIGEFTKTTQRIPVRIQLEEIPKDVILLPGMSAVVKVRAK